MLPPAWLHDINPIAVPIPGFLNGGIHWYGLAYLAGFFLAWLWLRRIFKVGAHPPGMPLPPAAAADFVSSCCLGLLIGGRLAYCLVYDRELLGFTSHPPFWNVLAIWKGGMASHGGMLGALAGAWWWTRKYKVPLLFAFDVAAFSAPLGLALGRIANFVNGELVGRPCRADFKLACQFPQEVLDWNSEKGLQRQVILEDGSRATGKALMNRLMEKYGDYPPLDRWHEIPWTGDAKLRTALEQVLPHRHPSTLYAAAAEGLAVFLCVLLAYKNPRRPGLVAGVFGIAYAAARIVGEMFRMPDAQFIAQNGDLPKVSMGQWLTLGVLGIGVFLVARALLDKKALALGGWKPKTETPGVSIKEPRP